MSQRIRRFLVGPKDNKRVINSTPLYDEKDRHIGYFVIRSLTNNDGWIATRQGTPSVPGSKADTARTDAVVRLMKAERGRSDTD